MQTTLQQNLTNYNNTRKFLHSLSAEQLQQLLNAMQNKTLTFPQVESAYDAVSDAAHWRLIKNL
jgi:acetylglutamate kinase